jgi:hypothetical protein
MVMQRQLNEKGSVTAELALAMPAVSLVIEIERMKLVGVAAMAARAIARGETQENVRALVLEMSSTTDSQQINVEIETRENTVCINLSRNFEIAGLPGKLFDFSELQCARKVGL